MKTYKVVLIVHTEDDYLNNEYLSEIQEAITDGSIVAELKEEEGVLDAIITFEEVD